jgi:hypothetical protein
MLLCPKVKSVRGLWNTSMVTIKRVSVLKVIVPKLCAKWFTSRRYHQCYG